MPELKRNGRVNSGSRLPRLVALAVIAITIISIGMFKAIDAYRNWSAGERMPPELPKHPQLPPAEPPDPYALPIKYPPEIDSRHLLDGSFAMVNRMSDLTGICQDSFQSSFVNYWNPSATPKQIAFANLGEDFEEFDFIRGGLPFRRLVLAGLGTERCFVYYEAGGRMGPATCLAVMDYSQRKAIWVGEWVGELARKVANIKELRNKLHRQQFVGEDQHGC